MLGECMDMVARRKMRPLLDWPWNSPFLAELYTVNKIQGGSNMTGTN